MTRLEADRGRHGDGRAGEAEEGRGRRAGGADSGAVSLLSCCDLLLGDSQASILREVEGLSTRLFLCQCPGLSLLSLLPVPFLLSHYPASQAHISSSILHSGDLEGGRQAEGRAGME